MPLEPLNDRELVYGYLEGRDDYLEILIQKYLKIIYNFVYSHTQNESVAEDLTQETFIKAWRHLGSFDNTKSFKAWLFKITKNNLIDWLRQKKKTTFLSLDENHSLEETITALNRLDYVSEETLEHIETTQQLIQAIDQLPEKYRVVVTKYYQEGKSLKEISQMLQLPFNTVKSHYHIAIILLKKLL